MDFQQQLRDVLKEHFNDHESVDSAVQKLRPELSGKCENDADTWGLLGSFAANFISDISGLDITASKWLKERAKRLQQSIISGDAPQAPTDAAERMLYLLEKEGFKVCNSSSNLLNSIALSTSIKSHFF
jgi:hypothetical protein